MDAASSYRIGVSIVLANGVSPVLAIIGKDLLGLKTSVSEIEHNFGGWATTLIGVGGILAGATILGAMGKLAEKAADFQDAMTKVSQLNPKVAALVQNREIQKLSFDVGTKLGMKVEDVANVYGGIYGVLQDPKEAEELTPIAARYARLMQMRHPGSHPEASINTAMRAGELAGRLTDDKGAIDPGKVKAWYDLLARLDAGTHGQFNPDTAFGLAQQAGGLSLRGLSEEGYEHMAIVSQMMGGQRAGTSLLSLRSQMTGNMMKRSAAAMQDYGLLNPGEATSEGGHVELTDAAAHRMLDLVNKDPMKFVNELVDKLEAKGITNKDDQMLALQRILGRQTTQRMVSDMLLARAQMQRETKGLDEGMSVDQGLAGYDRNIHAAQQNLGAAWHNLQVAMGEQETEKFASIINRIARGLNSVTDAITRLTPEQMDKVFQVITGVAVGLIALGGIITAALITSIVGLPAIIGAAVVALGALAAFNWDKITGWLSSDSISQWLNRSLIDPVYAWLQSDSLSAPVTQWLEQSLTGPIQGWLKSDSISASVGQWFSRSLVDPIQSWLSSDSLSAPMTQWLNRELIDPISGWLKSDSISSSVVQWLNRSLIDPVANWLKSDSISSAVLEKMKSIFTGISSALSPFVDSIAAIYNRVKGVFATPSGKDGEKPAAPSLDDAYKYSPMRYEQDSNQPKGINDVARYIPARFAPGNDQPRSQQASFSLNVDGHALAQSVIDHLESIYGMPTGAAAADGVHSPFGGDHQYTNA